MRDKEMTDLMAELDEILGDSGSGYESQQIAKDVKLQVKYAEIHGGADKILVGRVKKKTALWAENRVEFTLTEAIYTAGGETVGTQTHTGCLIDCDNTAGVAAVLNTVPPYSTFMAVDRKTRRVLASWMGVD